MLAQHGGPDFPDNRQVWKLQFTQIVLQYAASIRILSRPPQYQNQFIQGGRWKSSYQKSSDDAETTRRSLAYTPSFAQRLVINCISLVRRCLRAANHQEWNEALMRLRPSLSPSHMYGGHYDQFVDAIDAADYSRRSLANPDYNSAKK